MAATFNEDIEIKTLACLFKDGSLFSVVEDILSRSSFGWNPFGIVFQSIKDIVNDDIYPDVTTVLTDLDRKGRLDSISILSNGKRGKEAVEYIASLEVDHANIESYAYFVSELHANRQLRDLADKIKSLIDNGERPQKILADIDFDTGRVATYIGLKSKNTRTAKDVAKSSVERFDEASQGKDLYIPTHIKAWDDYTNGLFPGRLYMVAGASNDGKSTLVLDIIKNLSVDNNVKTMLATFESGAEEIHNKLVQILTGIPTLRIEKANLTEDELQPFQDATKRISESPIIYDDSPEITLPLLRTKIRKAVADGVRVVVIDQLEQISIGGSGDNQQEYIKLNYISYRIKAMCRENNIPIILVHQLNRGLDSGQSRGKDIDPQVNDLAQAGEKACDAILIIRHKKQNQIILESFFNWVKHRQGAKGKVQVTFVGKYLTFKDLNEGDMPEFFQENLVKTDVSI